ncbi:MAG: peptide-binding protein [Elusimicrobiota bacterium]|nr:peptide-binding protein [Elusimicrobiota bacterium]
MNFNKNITAGLYVTGCLTALLFLSACGDKTPASGQTGGARGGMIIRGSIADASYLNPILASDSASGDINALVFSGLVKYNKDLELVGELAESFSVSEDNLKIIFNLCRGIKWHDGKEFTSSDVLFTYNTIISTATRTPYASSFDRVKRVTAPGPYKIVVEYSEPYAPALESWGMSIIPEHLYRGTDVNTNPHNRDPVGTGPYRFVRWHTDDRIVLEASEDYFEGRPDIGRFIYKIIPDQSVQFMELRRGTIDWMSPTPDQWVAETSDEEFQSEFNRYRYPSFGFTYMAFNLNNPLFKSRRVRRAVSYAIDKELIIEAVLQGLGTIATGPYPPVSWAYDSEINDYGYDPQKALEILKKEGWEKDESSGILKKDGRKFSFTLMTNQGNQTRKLAVEIIQDQLKDIGIDVDVRVQEWSSFINQYIDKRQFDAVLLGWSLSVDPDQYPLWHSSQTGEGQYNFTGFKNKKVDNLLREGRRTFNVGRRKEIYKEIHRILHLEQPYIFLYFDDSKHVIHHRFRNIKPEKAGIAYNITDWYVPENLRKY